MDKKKAAINDAYALVNGAANDLYIMRQIGDTDMRMRLTIDALKSAIAKLEGAA